MIKKTSLFYALLLLTATLSTHKTHAMEPTSQQPIWHGYAAYVGNVLLDYIEFDSQEFPESPQLTLDIQSTIKNLLYNITTTKDLQFCARAINNLAHINDDLADLINNPVFCLKLIKHLSKRFKCSNQEAAAALQTQEEAQKRLEIQRKFLTICKQESFNEEQFNLLYEQYKEYVDLNFTFYIITQHKQIDITLLMFAVKNNNCVLIKKLLDNGANINKTNSQGSTALHFAVYDQNMDTIQCLLSNPAIAMDKPDKNGMTALMAAVHKNNCPIIQTLLDHGANINATGFNNGTALTLAVFTEKTQIVTCLLNYPNIAINHQDDDGNSALLMALSTGNKLIIKLLLKNGADPEIANNDDLTPWQLAQHNGDREIIQKIYKAILKKDSAAKAA